MNKKFIWLVNKSFDESFIKNVEYMEYIPFSNQLMNIEIVFENFIKDNYKTDYFSYSGTSILKLKNIKDNLDEDDKKKLHNVLRKNNLDKKYLNLFLKKIDNSIFHNEYFDQNILKNFNLPLLNSDSEFFDLKDKKNLNKRFKEAKFIKPSNDEKSFCAGIIEREETIEYFIKKQIHNESALENIVLISDLKKIDYEFRFFVINKEIITGSKYFENNKLKIENINNSIGQEAWNFATDCINNFCPSANCVIDVCLTNGKWKIVEFNAINCSGFYACDTKKINEALKCYFENKIDIKEENIKKNKKI